MSEVNDLCYHVFVYGTLKRGQPNNHFLIDPKNGQAKFVGSAVALEKRPLVIYSQYNIPFLLDCPGSGENIEGDVYRVDTKMLQWMDAFEEHPDYYLRTKIKVRMADGSDCEESIKEVWTYLLQNYREDMLKRSHIKCYNSYGDHGLAYVESEETRSLQDL